MSFDQAHTGWGNHYDQHDRPHYKDRDDDDDDDTDIYERRILKWPIIVSVVVVVIFVVALVWYCCCCRKKKVQQGKVIHPPQGPVVVTNEYPASAADVVTRYDRSVSNSDVYIVPFSALPAHFDYSSRGVEVRGDYVILKNLSLLDPSVNYEAYRQSPYNPNVYNAYSQQNMSMNPPPYTPNPNMYPAVPQSEAYQKQASYNPAY